jgi:hypothetical protein
MPEREAIKMIVQEFGSPIILKGDVKIRHNLIFKRKRKMCVQENGNLVILKPNGKIEDAVMLTERFAVKMIKG